MNGSVKYNIYLVKQNHFIHKKISSSGQKFDDATWKGKGLNDYFIGGFGEYFGFVAATKIATMYWNEWKEKNPDYDSKDYPLLRKLAQNFWDELDLAS